MLCRKLIGKQQQIINQLCRQYRRQFVMSSKKPIVYGTPGSPSVQAVLMTLKELGTDYEMRLVEPGRGDNVTTDYLSKNPSRTIPTLEDEGHFIGDSHAIMAFLVSKYGKDDRLYPKDLYRRAAVDQLLHFENGVLFITCVKQVFGPIFAGLRSEVPVEKLQVIERSFGMLEAFFGKNKFVADENMTIADISCLTSVINMRALCPIDERKYPKITAWLQHMESLPYFDEVVNNEKTRMMNEFVLTKLGKL